MVKSVVHGVMGCGQKSFKLLWRCHKLLSEFKANGYLPRVSRQSRLSANDKDDYEMIPGSVHRSTGIYLTAEKNPGKSHLGRPSVRPVMASNGVLHLQMTSLGSYNTYGKGREGKKERMGLAYSTFR